jgi:hypothetical protein
MKSNDLVDFMNSMTREIQDEYNRIQKRATEDPGTAGDQGEENWASLIKNWLPSNFKVVTKGRIINEDGDTSPQVDLIILPPEYPNYLLNKKLYLAGGILAAFECKLTLKSNHIEDFIKNSVAIRSLYRNRTGTPYKELHSPMIYGLLAHSHIWKQEGSTPIQNIESKLKKFDSEYITNPIHMPDIICVADLATWNTVKVSINEPLEILESKAFYHQKRWNISAGYVCHSNFAEDQVSDFSPIGALIKNFLTAYLL